jgi:hypothetical protein
MTTETLRAHLAGIETRLKWIPISREAKTQRDIDICWMRDQLRDALDREAKVTAVIEAARELSRFTIQLHAQGKMFDPKTGAFTVSVFDNVHDCSQRLRDALAALEEVKP